MLYDSGVGIAFVERAMFQELRQRFPLGRIVATPNAVATLNPKAIMVAIHRHISGDWGEVDAHDRAANEAALRHGGRLLSVYRDSGGIRFYIVTEADRSVTTVLLPEDY